VTRYRRTGLAAGLRSLVLLTGLAVTIAGGEAATDAQPTGEPFFSEVADRLGVGFEHQRGRAERFWLPEIMSGGAAWLDYDDDGDLDLYLVQGGELTATGEGDRNTTDRPGNRLYRNDGAGGFLDVTDDVGVGDTGYGMGAAVGDVNGDGAVDLYVTNVGRNVLFVNGRNGTFRRVEAGVDDAAWGASAAFSDIDLDGDLDLFLVNYVAWSPANEVECFSGGLRDYCHPDRYRSPQADRLFRNLGDGVFDDVSDAAGLGRAFGNGLGIAPLDFDADGRPDFYVANDGMPNQLWINLGDGRFADRAIENGCAVNSAGSTEAGMGVAVGDVDGDGRRDLLLTHLRQETNTLYLNRGGFCEDATARFGLAAPSINRTGFGTGLIDFDHDGFLDLFVANGRIGRAQAPHVDGDPFAEPNQLYLGTEGARFRLLPPALSGSSIDNSRAAALGDFDGDGAMDVAVVTNGGPVRLLRNRATSGRSWVRFRLRDPAGADALGSKVAVEADGRVQRRRLESAYGYFSANEPVAEFGLGEATDLAAQVTWPDRHRRRYERLPARRTVVVYR
jgi:hypothetical protein